MDFREFVVATEFIPPYTPDEGVLLRKIDELREIGVDTVSICSNPMARPKLPALYVADVMGPEFRRIVHYPCAGRSSIVFRSDLMSAIMIGVDALLVLHGDPHPECANEVDVLTRIRIAKAEPFTGILIGAAADPNAKCFDGLKAKKDAGADYFQTQPVFDERTLTEFLNGAQSLELPILMGIMIPSKKSQLETLAKIPGVTISEEYLAKFRDIQNDGAFVANATAEAIRLIDVCKGACAGVYLSAAPSQLRYLKDLVNGTGESAGFNP